MTNKGPVGIPGMAGGVAEPYPHATSFSVITMGSGSPELNPLRASACTVVQHEGRYYVVDTGNGSALNFIKGGPRGPYRPQDIAAILFTHLHQDHVNDYFDLVTARWGAGGKHLDLVGPPGTAELHRFLVTFFRDDLLYRRLLDRPEGVDQEGMFEGVDVHELAGSNEFSLGDLWVTTAEMTHSMYNLAYRIEAEGKSVVISGDTAFDPRLIALSQGADVLVIDANPWADGSVPPPPHLPVTVLPESLREPLPYRGDLDAPNHMPLADVVRTTTEADVGTVVLTHLWPLEVDQELIRRTERAFREGGFWGRVVFAEDRLEVPVESRRDANDMNVEVHT